jgi:hypothetical protein
MNFIRFSARLARRGSSRAVAQIASRRRLAVVCSAALAAGLAGAAFTAVPASAATTGFCLDANAQQVYPGGAIIQWGCNYSDLYQQWSFNAITGSPYGELFQLQNTGALDVNDAADCLDADAQQVYPGGAIIQYGCNSSDPYQLWIAKGSESGALVQFQFENYGALVNDDAADCLDADAQQVYSGGAIIQYGCNSGDPYQIWQPSQGSVGGQLQNVGATEATGGIPGQ